MKTLVQDDLSSSDKKLRKAHLQIDALKKGLEETAGELGRIKEMLAHSLKQISMMVAERERTGNEVARLNQIQEDSFHALVSILSDAIESKLRYRRGHSKKVAEISVFIAREEKLPQEAVRDIEAAALLHEVGKLSLPDELAAKEAGEYTRMEKDLLINHPVAGASLLKKFPGFKKMAQIIRHIHEKINGNGVPDGLRQGDIPLGSRIVAAANMFDQLAHRESGGDVWKAFKFVEDEVGASLDGQLIRHLHKYTEKYPMQDAEKLKAMNLFELQPGMELAAGIFTLGGAKLLPVNTVLTDETIRQVAHYAKGEPVMETVFIK